MTFPLPTTFLAPLVVPEKKLMGPGPSDYPLRVRKALSNPVLGHMHPETLALMDEIKEGCRFECSRCDWFLMEIFPSAGVKYLFQTNNVLTLCLSASGHAGMEAGLCNLIEDGDVVLIAAQGIWGERAAQMAKRHGADVRLIVKSPGDALKLTEVREAFIKHKPSLFFVAHGESSTGMLQDLTGFGELCRAFDCMLMVDAVITLGCVPFLVDEWKIDVAYSGSQKVLNAPPGITPITFSSRAM